MKRLICMFLSAMLLLSLAACGGGNSAPGAEGDGLPGSQTVMSDETGESSAPKETPHAGDGGDQAQEQTPAAAGEGQATPAESGRPEGSAAPEASHGPAAESQAPSEGDGPVIESAAPEASRAPAVESQTPAEDRPPAASAPPVESQGPAGESASPAPEASAPVPEEEHPRPEETEEQDVMEQNVFYVTVGGVTFTADFAENVGAQALKELLAGGPVTLSLRDYGGFEKVGALGQSLPTSNSQTTTQAGDIVLYQGDQIVMFYGSNSWSYTRLGRIADLTGWEEALGGGDVSVTLSLAQG